MKNLLFTLVLSLICFQGFSQNFPDLRYYEAEAINLFYSHETEDNPLFLGVLTNDAHRYFSKVLGESDMQVNLLVLNKNDWGIYTSKQLIYGMPHWRRTDNAIIVASDDNFFWAAHMPSPSLLKSSDKELFEETYGTEDGGLSARFFFDLGTIHELTHLWIFNAGRETQRIWLEEIFCNLSTLAFIRSERPEWVSGLELLANYQIANNKVPLQYTSLETFEENRNRIVVEAPQNYGWYQFRFIDAANKLYDAGGEELLKNLWNFLGKYQERLSDKELKKRLSEEVHPYFKVLMEEW
jgi:hypothetical protein